MKQTPIKSYLNYSFNETSKATIIGHILIGITIIMLTGCFKTLDFNLDFEGEKIVVRGTLSPQDGAIIQISHTLDPTGTYLFDTLNLNLDNAIVELYANDVLLQQIPYSEENERYIAKNLTLSTDAAYHLTVAAAGFPSVQTEKISIPELPETTFNVMGENEEELRIDIELVDNLGTSYYELNTSGIYQNEVMDIYPYLIGSFEQWEICGLTGDFSIGSVYISDDCFKNKNFLFPTLIDTHFFRPLPDSSFLLDHIRFEELVVNFRSITSERYDFVVSTDVPEDIDNAFREPAITFSNIIGGHGYFSAYQETTLRHKL